MLMLPNTHAHTHMHWVLGLRDSVGCLTLLGELEVIEIQSEVSVDVHLILNPKGVAAAHIYTFYETHR